MSLNEAYQDVKSTSRAQILSKKSIVIESMINLTGKGARLGVLKLSDAETSKSIGRIQARRADDVSFTQYMDI